MLNDSVGAKLFIFCRSCIFVSKGGSRVTGESI